MTTWHMRIASSIPKSKSTYSEYVRRIALQLQQWVHERASMLRTYTGSLVTVYPIPLFIKYRQTFARRS
jgi:hypothetical protein